MRRTRRVLIAGGALTAAVVALDLAATTEAVPSHRPKAETVAKVFGSSESAFARFDDAPGRANTVSAERIERDAHGRVGGRVLLRSSASGNPTVHADAPRDTQARSVGAHEATAAAHDSSLLWPRLDPIDVRPDLLTARITGTDPVGERRLVLWRRLERSTSPIAETSSDRSGRFDFGELPIPNGALQLVVTPAGGDPLAPSPLEAKRPKLPLLVANEFDSALPAEARRLRVFPSTLDGELQILDDGGALLDALPLSRLPALGLTLDEGQLAGATHIVHVLPDGRRSDAIEVGAGALRW